MSEYEAMMKRVLHLHKVGVLTSDDAYFEIMNRSYEFLIEGKHTDDVPGTSTTIG